MAVKMRLTRIGDKKNSIYRIVVSDSRTARDGIYIEQVGFYNPKLNPAEVRVDVAKAQEWLNKGAQPTDTVKSLLKKNGVVFSTKKEDKKPAKKTANKATENASEKTAKTVKATKITK